MASSKEKLLSFLQANVGRVCVSKELQESAGGAVEFGRRLRECAPKVGLLKRTGMTED